ncbi:MAG: peptide ABC transporter substrate-binding protein, partial [Candidatus Scalindua sp.]|nr:peptide ABC transporter substrate-binding protein [Candidatus Scalindua sp.]
MMTGLPEMRLAEALFEGLVTYDPSDLTPRPGVAESWDVSDDGLIYTFHLRKDAKWSDGK